MDPRAGARDSSSIPSRLTRDTRKELLQKLIEAEQFEQFLHKKYLGQKRFSLEGCETVIPMLDQLVEGASARGVDEIYMGMAHRGRLNVLSNIVGDPGNRRHGRAHLHGIRRHVAPERSRPTKAT